MKKLLISGVLFFLLVLSVSALWDNIIITRRINITTNVTNVSNTYNNYTNNYNQSLNTSDSVMFNNLTATNIFATGNVGIGTAGPTDKLSVGGTINALALKVNNTAGLNATYTILKDVDLVGLTKTYCNLTFTGGLMTGSNC